jgi:hypothetical protein
MTGGAQLWIATASFASFKASSAKKAAAYKALAHNQEWLGGEEERSSRRK